MGDLMALMFLGIIGLLVYFIPAQIAFSREHHNKVPILVVNILLGWTFIGWVAALAWSLTATDNS